MLWLKFNHVSERGPWCRIGLEPLLNHWWHRILTPYAWQLLGLLHRGCGQVYATHLKTRHRRLNLRTYKVQTSCMLLLDLERGYQHICPRSVFPCDIPNGVYHFSRWRHQMETFSALLAICAGNSPVTGEFPAQSPVTRSMDDFFICALMNGWVNNGEVDDLRRHCAHYDVTVMGHTSVCCLDK